MQMTTDMMEHLAKQDKAKKANNKCLNVISNALTPPTATDGEQTPRRVYSLLHYMELVVRPVVSTAGINLFSRLAKDSQQFSRSIYTISKTLYDVYQTWSLRKRSKEDVSKVHVPDSTLSKHSATHFGLAPSFATSYPTISLQDALHREHSFIAMEEDK
ncbi:hypothetical protein F2Q70_00035932 [Brassica cretica]|uniref:Uncharacterized protein n=1 Tax=Brassica cretica TaxID=69181 RepID=A0A8S9JTY6_BRACR|nr:hypothetical protein F2Q70_00035932 [Brassica cretica]